MTLKALIQAKKGEFQIWYDRTRRLSVLANVPPEKKEKQLSQLERDNEELFAYFFGTALTEVAEAARKDAYERVLDVFPADYNFLFERDTSLENSQSFLNGAQITVEKLRSLITSLSTQPLAENKEEI